MARSRLMLTRKQRKATGPSPAESPVASLGDERLTRRLAEMVTALSECESTLATDAVRAILATGSHLDALEVVAMALIAVEARQRGQLRVPGYLRPDDPGAGFSTRRAVRRAHEDAGADAGSAAPSEPEPGGVVVDLRGEHARVQLDLTGHDHRLGG